MALSFSAAVNICSVVARRKFELLCMRASLSTAISATHLLIAKLAAFACYDLPARRPNINIRLCCRSARAVALAVTVHEVRLLSDSGKSDYALVGEGFALNCLFMLEPDEVIHSVIWKKDGTQVS